MKSQRLLIAAVAIALATTAQAQVKVGSNPGTISTNAVLDVEGTGGSHTVVLQNGDMGVGIAAPTTRLHVSGANNYGLLKLQSSNGTSEVLFQNNTGGPWYVGKNSGNGGTNNMNFSYNATTPVVTMTSSGSVGIGIPTPATNLHVLNSGAGGNTVTTSNTANIGFQLEGAGNGQAIIQRFLTRDASGANKQFLLGVNPTFNSGKGIFYIGRDGSNDMVMDLTTAYVGIGQGSPTRRLDILDNSDISLLINSTGGDMNGMITLNASARPTSSNIDQFMFFQQSGTNVGSIVSNGSGGVTYQTTSDKRLKENIVATHFGIKDLMKIGVKDYTMKGIPGKVRTGFLAQDLHAIYPEAVAVGGEDAAKNPWTVDYGRVTPLLIKSIQDQQLQIEALKKKNQALEAQAGDMASLRSELDAIKALVLKGSPAQKATTVTKR